MSSNGLITIKPQSLDAMTLGQTLAQSGFFSDSRQAAQAVVKVLAGQELGLGPIASMTGIYIVKGKVTLSANAMASVIKNSGRYDYRVTEHNDTICTVEYYEQGKRIGISSFSMQDAQRAGLAGGDNWKKYPRNMLFARAMSNGAKWFCADVFAGSPVYTPDELGATVDGESGQVIDAVEVEDISPPPPEPEPKSMQAQAFDAFLNKCHSKLKLSPDQAKGILKGLGYSSFFPDRAGDLFSTLEAQFNEGVTCEAALLVIANRETDNYYNAPKHIQNTLVKVNPDFAYPPDEKDRAGWQEALAMLIEYAEGNKATEQPPLVEVEATEAGFSYE